MILEFNPAKDNHFIYNNYLREQMKNINQHLTDEEIEDQNKENLNIDNDKDLEKQFMATKDYLKAFKRWLRKIDKL